MKAAQLNEEPTMTKVTNCNRDVAAKGVERGAQSY